VPALARWAERLARAATLTDTPFVTPSEPNTLVAMSAGTKSEDTKP
jgi:hypothetical protein